MRFKVNTLTRDKREALLEWVQAEGLVESDILDDGRFSVHNGWISGSEIIRSEDGSFNVVGNEIAHKHFRVKQKNPLPEILETS